MVDSPRYTGQQYQPDGNSGSGYNYPSTGPSYPSRHMRNDTSGNRNRVDNDTYQYGDDEGYASDTNHPQSTPYSNGSASQRGNAYSSNE